MPDPTPDPEPIIELVEHIPWWWLVLAFAAGGLLVAAIVLTPLPARFSQSPMEDADNA